MSSPYKGQKMGLSGAIRSFGKLFLFILIMCIAYCYYNYTQGKRLSENDINYKEPSEMIYKGKKNRNGSTSSIVIVNKGNDYSKREASAIMFVDYYSKDKTPRLISFFPQAIIKTSSNQKTSLAERFKEDGPEGVRALLKESLDLDSNYYCVLSPYALEKSMEGLIPDGVTFQTSDPFTTKSNFIDYAIGNGSEANELAEITKDQLVFEELHKASFTLKNSLHVPRGIGIAHGYMATNLPGRVYTSMLKDFILGQNKPLKKMILPIECLVNGKDTKENVTLDDDKNKKIVHDFLN